MIKPSARYVLYESHAQILENIAKQYPPDSDEVAALKESAFALCFALTEKYDEFRKYLEGLQRPLTEEEEKYLRELGLEP